MSWSSEETAMIDLVNHTLQTPYNRCRLCMCHASTCFAFTVCETLPITQQGHPYRSFPAGAFSTEGKAPPKGISNSSRRGAFHLLCNFLPIRGISYSTQNRRSATLFRATQHPPHTNARHGDSALPALDSYPHRLTRHDDKRESL